MNEIIRFAWKHSDGAVLLNSYFKKIGSNNKIKEKAVHHDKSYKHIQTCLRFNYLN